MNPPVGEFLLLKNFVVSFCHSISECLQRRERIYRSKMSPVVSRFLARFLSYYTSIKILLVDVRVNDGMRTGCIIVDAAA